MPRPKSSRKRTVRTPRKESAKKTGKNAGRPGGGRSAGSSSKKASARKSVRGAAARRAASPGVGSEKRAVRNQVLAERAQEANLRLAKRFPDAECALNFSNPYELSVATILSAQCTDKRVNMVTPDLFGRWPEPKALAGADQGELEEVIRSTGFYRNKARNLIGFARKITDEHGGKIPDSMEKLRDLPGFGRKTANVILGNAFGIPGITVDTHMGRVARRLGLTKHTDPVKVEFDLMELLPPEEWTMFSHRVISHGREICDARKPRCSACPLDDICPKVGVEKAA